MTERVGVNDVRCASLDLSQTKWVCAFSAPESVEPSVRTFAGGAVEQLVGWLNGQRQRAEASLGRPLKITLCYESGYDGFWLARLLPTKGVETIVFDPASFLRPRRGRLAKTDRLDAQDMIRTLRAWLSGDAAVARQVRVPSVTEEDAKRLARERKHLVNERTPADRAHQGHLRLAGGACRQAHDQQAMGCDARPPADRRRRADPAVSAAGAATLDAPL